MTKKILLIFSIFFFAFSIQTAIAEDGLGYKLRGRILLQIEGNGEAWYVHPESYFRFYLGRPDDAFLIMKNQGIGITDENLKRIPISLDNFSGQDTDNDGLPDAMEESLGADKYKVDSDNDGFSDLVELENGYDPIKSNGAKLPLDLSFADKQKGKILLQIERNGEAWYVNPVDGKRYFLSRPTDAFAIMRKLGLGITDENLAQIFIDPGQIADDNYFSYDEPDDICASCDAKPSAKEVLDAVAKAFRENNKKSVLNNLTEDMQFSGEHTFDFLTKEERFTLGNMMSGAKLVNSSDTEAVYSVKIQFMNWETNYKYTLLKQEDNSWKLSNL